MYLRSKKVGLILNCLSISFAVLIIVGLVILIFMNKTFICRAHGIVGSSMLVLVFVQINFGYFSFKRLIMPSNMNPKEYVVRDVVSSNGIAPYVHRTIGFIPILASWVQIALGLDKMYPWVEPMTCMPWVVYAFMIFFWIAAEKWHRSTDSTISECR
jgi:sterol desaturase/sphingolipid hydroxylase (fatty acid hydroxylase superfamily)